jgi:hypothetical protein
MQKRRLSSLILLLVLLGAIALVWWQRFAVYDYFRLRNYRPPAAVAALADHTTMTNSARHIFYVYHPEIDERDAFNQHCALREKNIVLGCYIMAEGIFIHNVDDPRLNGIEEVTAAHEMLHAAYDRLSPSERTRINNLLEQYYQQSSDENFKAKIALYQSSEPEQLPNELHSIVGTEVGPLPAGLETYYKRYFTNRAAVVALAQKYDAAFNERKAKIDAYDKQLKSLLADIKANEAAIDAQVASLNQQRQALDHERQSGQIEAYNAAVPGYNAQVSQINAKVKTTQNLIDRYNSILDAREAIALESSELYKAIDNRPTTVQAR